MKFLRNVRINTIGWALVSVMVAAGIFFVASALVTVDRISEIKKTWDSFEEGHSEEAVAFDALHRAIGYGGMVHHFKNYILRGERKNLLAAQESFVDARAAITRLRTLGVNDDELKALADIEIMLLDYRSSMTVAKNLFEAGRPIREIDRQAQVDDKKALAGLDFLAREIEKTLGGESGRPSKLKIIASLHRELGYGGMIHHFKNYILRGSPELLAELEKKFSTAHALLGDYRQFPITDAEKGAIQSLIDMLQGYERNLDIAFRLLGEGATPKEIDKVARINDSPAPSSFIILVREIALQNKAEEKKVTEAFLLVSWVSQNAVWVSLILVVLMITFSLWMIRARIIRPIREMTAIMTQLAGGDLTVAVQDVDQETEIGEMARAVEVFRINAIERQRARDAAQRMGRIVEDSSNEIYIFDADTLKFTDANKGARENSSYSLDELWDLTIMDLKHEFSRDTFEALVAPLRSDQIKTLQFETVHKRQDGSLYPVEVNLQYAPGEIPPVFVEITQDISDRHQAEQAKKEFVSTVSHELRTPLTSIMGALGLVRGGAAGDVSKEAGTLVEVAYENSNRLIRLINDILDMEKIEAGKMDFKMRPLQLGPFLEKALEANKGYGETQNVSFVLSDNEPGEAKVTGDYDRLMQVLSNLLSNAAKFSPEHSEIKVSLSRRDDMYRVAVSDQGPGIDDDYREFIFQKFSQADSTDARQKGGTGLGLSIAKAIIEEHGGSIGFESRPGQGAMFFFDLPVSTNTLTDQPTGVLTDG